MQNVIERSLIKSRYIFSIEIIYPNRKKNITRNIILEFVVEICSSETVAKIEKKWKIHQSDLKNLKMLPRILNNFTVVDQHFYVNFYIF